MFLFAPGASAYYNTMTASGNQGVYTRLSRTRSGKPMWQRIGYQTKKNKDNGLLYYGLRYDWFRNDWEIGDDRRWFIQLRDGIYYKSKDTGLAEPPVDGWMRYQRAPLYSWEWKADKTVKVRGLPIYPTVLQVASTKGDDCSGRTCMGNYRKTSRTWQDGTPVYQSTVTSDRFLFYNGDQDKWVINSEVMNSRTLVAGMESKKMGTRKSLGIPRYGWRFGGDFIIGGNVGVFSVKTAAEAGINWNGNVGNVGNLNDDEQDENDLSVDHIVGDSSELYSGKLIGFRNRCHSSKKYLSCYRDNYCELQNNLFNNEKFYIRKSGGGLIRDGDMVVLDWGGGWHLSCPFEGRCDMTTCPNRNNGPTTYFGKSCDKEMFEIFKHNTRTGEVLLENDLVYLKKFYRHYYDDLDNDKYLVSGKDTGRLQTVRNSGLCERWNIRFV